MVAERPNGNGWAQKILILGASGLWVLLAGAYLALNAKVGEVRDGMALASASIILVKGSIDRIEQRLAVIDTAADVAATDQRNRSLARIAELEAIERGRDRAAPPPQPQ